MLGKKPVRQTPLQLALARGTQPGAELDRELYRLGHHTVATRGEAEDICAILKRIRKEGSSCGGADALHSVVALFQEVLDLDCRAYPILARKGTRLLISIVDEALAVPDRYEKDAINLALKMLAVYRTKAGTDAVIRAAQLPWEPATYMWSVVLSVFAPKHPGRRKLYEALRDPLPPGFLAVSLLDSANHAHREGATDRHPFDSPEGVDKLENWLKDANEAHFSYAHSAAGALPFLEHPQRDSLLALAFEHPDADVQTAAAWAAVKLGREAGVRWLTRNCIDVNRSVRSRGLLAELNRADAIPREAYDPAFQARAEFSHWLSHPNELGRPPDDVEVFDHRTLRWPPDGHETELWLVRYCMKDTTGLKDDDIDVGMIGSITFCLFTYGLEQRPPEDCYAIHCAWEMATHKLLEATPLERPTPEYDSLLTQHTLSGIGNVKIVAVAEISPELNYGQGLVALAEADRDGHPGWLVVDGLRSRWYARDEMPERGGNIPLLYVHIGRVLLGFTGEPDRRSYLPSPSKPRTPQQIVAAYEKILNDAKAHRQVASLPANYDALGWAFDDYVSSLAQLRAIPPAAATCAAYQALLDLHEALPADYEAIWTGPLEQNFDAYADALMETGQQSKLPATIQRMQSYWKDDDGLSRLARAAFNAELDQIAEELLLTLRPPTDEEWHRFTELDWLAIIWNRSGKSHESKTMLLESLQTLAGDLDAPTDEDMSDVETMLHDRVMVLRTLFPEMDTACLERLGIQPSLAPSDD
jgi:hypothetical protein